MKTITSASPIAPVAVLTMYCPSEFLGIVNARRVDEDDLRGFAGENAQDAIARGLRLGRDDGNLLAQQRVQQRGLAHVRLADNGDEAGTEAGGSGQFGIGEVLGCGHMNEK